MFILHSKFWHNFRLSESCKSHLEFKHLESFVLFWASSTFRSWVTPGSPWPVWPEVQCWGLQNVVLLDPWVLGPTGHFQGCIQQCSGGHVGPGSTLQLGMPVPNPCAICMALCRPPFLPKLKCLSYLSNNSRILGPSPNLREPPFYIFCSHEFGFRSVNKFEVVLVL